MKGSSSGTRKSKAEGTKKGKRAPAKTAPVDLAPYEEVTTPFDDVVKKLIKAKG